jgi:hypothetical protein
MKAADKLFNLVYELRKTHPILTNELVNINAILEKETAEYWYLRGFKDSETTETVEDISIEETLKDAKLHFEIVWIYQQ